MAKSWWSFILSLAIVGCSAASGGGESDPALEQQLQGLRTKNVELSKQLKALSSKAFERASKAEKKRNFKGSSRVVRSSKGRLGFDTLVLGPLKFKKKKAGTFYLNIGEGTSRGGLDDHKSSLSTKHGVATKKTSKKKTMKKKGRKAGTIKSGEKKHKVFIRKKGGN